MDFIHVYSLFRHLRISSVRLTLWMTRSSIATMNASRTLDRSSASLNISEAPYLVIIYRYYGLYYHWMTWWSLVAVTVLHMLLTFFEVLFFAFSCSGSSFPR